MGVGDHATKPHSVTDCTQNVHGCLFQPVAQTVCDLLALSASTSPSIDLSCGNQVFQLLPYHDMTKESCSVLYDVSTEASVLSCPFLLLQGNHEKCHNDRNN